MRKNPIFSHKNFKKNWRTWALSLLMALTLIGGGAGSILRAQRSARANHVTVTPQATPATPSASTTSPTMPMAAPVNVQALAIPPKFDQAHLFSAGLAAVQVGDQWGYINPTGKMVISPQFDYT